MPTYSPLTSRPPVQRHARWRGWVEGFAYAVLQLFNLRNAEFSSRRAAIRSTFVSLLALSALLGVILGMMLVYSVDLQQMEDLVRYRPNTTTELYDIHGNIFGSFALERRVVVPYEDFPPALRQAIISIEDKSFESNWGVNLFRAVGAAYRDLHENRRAQGSSTLTMQLARNLFLSSEKTYGRKFQEVMLSMQIERRFTKPQIFQLYANQIYLGHGTYGFEAGSQFYFSKHVRDLLLPEAALLAGLPKGPEAYSPIRHPEKALRRRNLVLEAMLGDGKITKAQAEAAKGAPLGLNVEVPPNSVAPYFVEELRRQLEKQYGAEVVHGAGLRVYTTLDLDLQKVANQAVLDGVATYERRRGWQAKLKNIARMGEDVDSYRHPDWSQILEKGGYVHGVVVSASPGSITVKAGSRRAVLSQVDWAWTQVARGDELVRIGDIVYLKVGDDTAAGGFRATLEQDSDAQASLMAVDNSNGEVLAMVGGRDYAVSQFNRATQSLRQVGSSFKPYVYTAAIEAGAKPTDVVVDAATSFKTASGWYSPHNYETEFGGPMTLIQAFATSRNIPALKLANQVGMPKVIETARRFGVTSPLPNFLPVAIGAADLTLYEQVGAYTVFPNDGIRIEPHLIRKLTQADGLPVKEKVPTVTEVLSVEMARTMMMLLKSVVQYGTGAAASQLHHPLGGKTGTTNNYTDAWFIGFSPSVTCGTWIGFDNRESLGKKETGAKAALPMWIDFMRAAVAKSPSEEFPAATSPKKVLQVAAARTPKPLVKDADDEDDTDDTPAKTPAPIPKIPEGESGTPPQGIPPTLD